MEVDLKYQHLFIQRITIKLQSKLYFIFHFFFIFSIKFHPKSYLESLLPEGWKKLDNFLGTLSYEFQAQEISTLFKEIGKHKDEYGIEFWGISQTRFFPFFILFIFFK